MSDLKKLKKLIDEIENLKKLRHGDPKTSVWINKVLRFLKKEFDEDSDYYRQFYGTTHGPVAVAFGTPDSEFQRRHLERLGRYGGYLKAFLEELEEEGEPIPGTSKYRAEITGSKERAEQRERAELRDYIKTHGNCPRFNDRLG